MITIGMTLWVWSGLAAVHLEDPVEHVKSRSELNQALMRARPGTTIRVAPGRYDGGLTLTALRGEPDRPIVITAEDPARPPEFTGGSAAFHVRGGAHLELSHLILTGATGNGLNIDDAGNAGMPAHHITLRSLTVRDVGPAGNRDGIKLSGLDDFRVETCTIERWGTGGSGIDMVGCHRGVIFGCTFRHDSSRASAGNGVQMKGGSEAIVVRACRFEEAGGRSVNIGGSTGRPFFRPAGAPFEARSITVEDCVFIGSQAPIAFVGVDGATVRHNVLYRPRKWGIRILQESRGPEFLPCRNGTISDNVIAFRSDEMTTAVNIGPDTRPETFQFARNAWYCLDRPARSRLDLPVPERDGIYGTDPEFVDPEHGDLRLQPSSALKARPGHPRPGPRPSD